MSADEAVKRVREALGDFSLDHLRRLRWHGHPNPLAGHCYVACEAVMALSDETLRPQVMRVVNTLDFIGTETHWFLRAPDGQVIDPTADQFDFPLDYERGRGNGMMRPGKPSKRAQELLDRIRDLG